MTRAKRRAFDQFDEHLQILGPHHRQQFFAHTDSLFSALNLNLTFVDGRNTFPPGILPSLREALVQTDSLVFPLSGWTVPESLSLRTLPQENDLIELLNQGISHKISSADDFEQSTSDVTSDAGTHLDHIVRDDDGSHNILCLLCLMPFVDCETTRYVLNPLMGGVIALRAGEGEIELRWAFSKLGRFLKDLHEADVKELRNLETIFALRLLAEAFYLEDLRIIRLANEQIVRSPQHKRFVSIVTVDMCFFARGFFETYLQLFRRHYEVTDGSGQTRTHAQSCKCYQRTLNTLKTPRVSAPKPRALGAPLAWSPQNCIAKRCRGKFRDASQKARVAQEVWSFMAIFQSEFDRMLSRSFEGIVVKSVVKTLSSGLISEPLRDACKIFRDVLTGQQSVR